MLVEEAFNLCHVKDFKELHDAYVADDQALFKSGEWDPNDHTQLINRIKFLLLQVDPSDLKEDDCAWRAEILWFYYHHGISYAMRRRDRKLAIQYAECAMRYQWTNHPNKITRLLWLLLNDKVNAARKWAEQIPPELDRQTAFELIRDYERGKLV